MSALKYLFFGVAALDLPLTVRRMLWIALTWSFASGIINALPRHGYKPDILFLHALSEPVLLLSNDDMKQVDLMKVDGWEPRVDGTASDSPGPLVPNFGDCPRLGCQPPTSSNHA